MSIYYTLVGGEENLANSGQIIHDAISQVDPPIQGYLCSKEAAYAKIRRARQRAGHNVKIIYSINDLPHKYRVTLGTQLKSFFQKRIESEDGSHGLIFTTGENMESLAKSRVWYSDGVFSITEKTYLQVYVIMGTLLNDPEQKARPLVYCIMSRKTMSLYESLFTYIKDWCETNNLEICTQFAKIDYEMAVKGAIEKVFDGKIKCNGCSFHLLQNIRNKAKEIKQHSIDWQLTANRIYALAYIPVDRLANVLNALRHEYERRCDSAPLELLGWFEKTYIDESSRFHGWWSVWPMVDELYPTTNNYAEAFFSKLRKLLNNQQTGLLNVIRSIQKVCKSIMTVHDLLLIHALSNLTGASCGRRLCISNYVQHGGKVNALPC